MLQLKMPTQCALCCSIFSFVGMIFCIFIGSLFILQPQFVPGLRISSSSAALNCYLTGAMYGLVFGFAVVSLRKQYAVRRDLIHGDHHKLQYQVLDLSAYPSDDALAQDADSSPGKSPQVAKRT